MLRPGECIVVACLAASLGGCTAILGFETPTAAPDAGTIFPGPDGGGLPDAQGPTDARTQPDAEPPDAAPGNPIHPIATGQPTIMGMALDLNGVYWSTIDGSITRCNKDGSAPHTIAAGPAQAEGALYVQNGFVYWATREPTSPFHLYRASVGGGGAFTRIVGSIFGPQDFVVDAGGITYSAGLDVSHAQLDGTMQTLTWGIANPSFYMARDATRVYYSVYDETNGLIEQVTLANGDESTLVSGLSEPIEVLTDGVRVYFSQLAVRDPAGGGGILPKTGSVQSVRVDGSEPLVVSTGETLMRVIAIDDGFVYWASREQKAILRRPKDNSAPAQIVTVPSTTEVVALAVDDTFVYVGTISTIERALKTPP